MNRNAFKFSPAKPGSSKAQAALVQVYLAAGYSVSDAEQQAARDVEAGRLRNACSRSSARPTTPRRDEAMESDETHLR